MNERFDAVERLADLPERGRVVAEVGVRRIRELIFDAYRMIYSVKDKVEILTVRQGSQLLDVSEIDDEIALSTRMQPATRRRAARELPWCCRVVGP